MKALFAGAVCISLFFSSCSSLRHGDDDTHALPDARDINSSAVARYEGKLRWPLSSSAITSPYGDRDGAHHRGVDIHCKGSCHIHATHDGTVVYSGRFGSYGNVLALKGEDGLLTMYAHNEKNMVRTGESVKKGDVIAEVGATGRASGPHLHYEIRVQNENGKYVAVNPLSFY